MVIYERDLIRTRANAQCGRFHMVFYRYIEEFGTWFPVNIPRPLETVLVHSNVLHLIGIGQSVNSKFFHFLTLLFKLNILFNHFFYLVCISFEVFWHENLSLLSISAPGFPQFDHTFYQSV